MPKSAIHALVFVCLFGCASTPDETVDLARAVYGYVDDVPGPVYYFPSRADLDGDGIDEAVVYLAGPSVCGTGGCPTLVYASEGDQYRLVTEIGPSRPPVRVAESSTNGWRDLVVRVSGGGIQPGYDALLKFDGRTYPANPTVAPAIQLDETPSGEIAIDVFDNLDSGQLLKPAK